MPHMGIMTDFYAFIVAFFPALGNMLFARIYMTAAVM